METNLGGRAGGGGKPYANRLKSQGEDVEDEEEDVQVDGIRHEAELLAIEDHHMGKNQVDGRADQDGAPVCPHEVDDGVCWTGWVGNQEDFADMADNLDEDGCQEQQGLQKDSVAKSGV